MTAEIPPIVPEERRQIERRKGWHTPDDCHKQEAIDSIFGHLADGNERMGAIEKCLSEYHKTAAEDRQRLEAKQDANNKDTAELLEIVQMGKGFFKTIWVTGKWIRRIILFIAPVVTAVVSMWYAITNKPQ